jgi:hypothetical protein
VQGIYRMPGLTGIACIFGPMLPEPTGIENLSIVKIKNPFFGEGNRDSLHLWAPYTKNRWVRGAHIPAFRKFLVVEV